MNIYNQKLQALEETPETGFISLVKTSGLDPARDLRYLNFETVDFADSKLEGFDFTGARIHGAQFSGALISGAIFDAVQWTLPELKAAKDFEEAFVSWRQQKQKPSAPKRLSPEWKNIWGSTTAPEWADEFGTDSYGKWSSFTYAGVTQVLRYCPPGRFLMGSPEDEGERFDNESPEVGVTFTSGFWLFDTAVSQDLYEAVTGSNPSQFKSPDGPVEQVNLYDAQSFVKRLNELVSGFSCRLASESEWEYACRAGSTTPFNPSVGVSHGGLSITPDEVNYDGNHPYGDVPKREGRQRTVPVKGGGFTPNNWGIWHMHGNVWEWCEDVWSDSHEDADKSGLARSASGQEDNQFLVLRGGSWVRNARNCRSAFRGRSRPGVLSGNAGLRFAAGQDISTGKPEV